MERKRDAEGGKKSEGDYMLLHATPHLLLYIVCGIGKKKREREEKLSSQSLIVMTPVSLCN